MAISSFLLCLYLNLVAVCEANYNKLYERQGFYHHFFFSLTVFNQQGNNCANLEGCLKSFARFHEEGFLTGMTNL